jgi:Ca-activated chloride channel family protein
MATFQLYFQRGEGVFESGILSHKPEEAPGFFMVLGEKTMRLSATVERNIIFVLDISGSMEGKRLEDAKNAIVYLLGELTTTVNFNLIAFEEKPRPWSKTLMPMNEENKNGAIAFVGTLKAYGGTKMLPALKTSFDLITDPRKQYYILFLTDGKPDEDEDTLYNYIQSKNFSPNVRMFPIALEEAANIDVLDNFANFLNGETVVVKSSEDLDRMLHNLFDMILGVSLASPSARPSIPVELSANGQVPDLMYGTPLVMTGRYQEGGDVAIDITGETPSGPEILTATGALSGAPVAGGYFIEFAWARERALYLLNALKADPWDEKNEGPRSKIVDELTAISKAYGLMTPYTSFLAREHQVLDKGPEVRLKATQRLTSLKNPDATVAARREAFLAILGNGDWGYPMPRAQTDSQNILQGLDEGLDLPAAYVTGGPESGALAPPRVLGDRAFFLKAGILIEGTLTENDLEGATPVKRLEAPYFALAGELPPQDAIWLSQREPIVFRHKGKVYRVD